MTRPKSAEPAGFDAVDDHGADYFVQFLDARTKIPGEIRVKELIKDQLRLRDGLAVLDVGSGTGTDTCDLVPSVMPHGSVVGVDLSARMVEEARRRASALGLAAEFIEGDAKALRFPDATFDRARAERILMLIDDPTAAVRELVRVTRPNGLVVLSEVDSGTMFLDTSDDDTADALGRALTAGLPHPLVGRHLARMLAEAGLVDVRCEPRVILNPVAFLRMVLGELLQGLVDAGQVSKASAAAFWAEQEAGEEAGWLCSGVICFTASGRKPG